MITVWVNGCFDVLHRGHLEMLAYARALGNRLVVGVDTDERVAAAKGPSRPFNKLDDRKYILNAIKHVDSVVSFGTDEELKEHLKQERINIMVVGSDWNKKLVVGADLVKEIHYFARIKGYSTTEILENTK